VFSPHPEKKRKRKTKKEKEREREFVDLHRVVGEVVVWFQSPPFQNDLYICVYIYVKGGLCL